MPTERDGYHKLRARRPDALFQRIENTVGTGVPDCFYVRAGNHAWIENKVGHYRSTLHKIVVPRSKLRKEQHAWLTNYVQKGGTGLVSVWVPDALGVLFVLPFSTWLWHELAEGIDYETLQQLNVELP